MNHNLKEKILDAISKFNTTDLFDSSINLFEILGYNTSRQLRLESPSFQGFKNSFLDASDIDLEKFQQKAKTSYWEKIELLFQLTKDEISFQSQLFDSKKYDNTIMESYLFFAIQLSGEKHTRTELATITRWINKVFAMPVMILFKYENFLTLSIINRRLHKKDISKDVLEKVTLIKDININNPHRAHIEILYDLSLENINYKFPITNFIDLHNAWTKILDISELNKKFYRDIATWYFYATNKVEFPADVEKNREIRNATNLIRLLTRIIFVWFIKEKGLVPDELFNKEKIDKILNYNDKTGSTYYKAILQNLFFAALNNDSDKKEFVNRQCGISTYYRYERFFKDKETFLELFKDIPFLNGGLFENLDKYVGTPYERRVDCFSNNLKNEIRLKVPDELFFGSEKSIDLNETFGTTNKKYKFQGLINILNSYKFTIDENTPIEEEIALDPELLGKVFENLLASYNPETQTTARKQTGSYYTPREIVDYMVTESLKLALSNLVAKKLPDVSEEDIKIGLDILFEYTEKEHLFNETEVEAIVEAISDLKILDPACGSGAFPMGILHKLVFILNKLDAKNVIWRKVIKNKILKEMENILDIEDKKEREEQLKDIDETFEQNIDTDYGRKLYLIENCIYGVDIQPIAVQISKLRFFISLIVEQKIDENKQNYGIRPLPNLETKFVAANSLIGIEKHEKSLFDNKEIEKLEKELKAVRHKIFSARTSKTKTKYRKRDKEIRERIAQLLEESEGLSNKSARQLASWDPYEPNKVSPFFDMEWMFGITDGFDIVIVNPPYIGEKGHKNLFRSIKQYTLKKFYQGKMDIFYFFFHLALNITKQNGFIAFITTNYFLTATGAKKLRQDLKKRSIIKKIINFNELKIFGDLGEHNMITILQKGQDKNAIAETCITEREGAATQEKLLKIFNKMDEKTHYYKVQQNDLYDGKEYYIRLMGFSKKTNNPIQGILDKISRQGILLKNICKINSGADITISKITKKHVKNFKGDFSIGDGVFVLTLKDLNNLKLDRNEQNLLKPFIKNSEIDKFFIKPIVKKLIYLKWTDDINKFPHIKEHLLKFKDILVNQQKRYEENYPWYALHRPRNQKIFEAREKILVPYRNKKNKFGYSTYPLYASRDVFFITEKDKSVYLKYILALLNSKLYYLWFYHRGKRKGEMLELYQKPLSELPIKKIPEEQQKSFIELVDKILAKKENQEDTTAEENQIDLLVYKLYNLTYDEIKIIDLDIEKIISKPEWENLYDGK